MGNLKSEVGEKKSSERFQVPNLVFQISLEFMLKFDYQTKRKLFRRSLAGI